MRAVGASCGDTIAIVGHVPTRPKVVFKLRGGPYRMIFACACNQNIKQIRTITRNKANVAWITSVRAREMCVLQQNDRICSQFIFAQFIFIIHLPCEAHPRCRDTAPGAAGRTDRIDRTSMQIADHLRPAGVRSSSSCGIDGTDRSVTTQAVPNPAWVSVLTAAGCSAVVIGSW